MARANPQWQELLLVEECLVVFQGPQAYVTPSWYATKRETGKVVPTWNYAAVHAWGRPRVIDDPVWLRRQLERLTSLNEGRLPPEPPSTGGGSLPAPWQVSDAPEPFIAAQMKGIIGIEIPDRAQRGEVEGEPEPPRGRPRWCPGRVPRAGERSGAMAALVAEHVGRRVMG